MEKESLPLHRPKFEIEPSLNEDTLSQQAHSRSSGNRRKFSEENTKDKIPSKTSWSVSSKKRVNHKQAEFETTSLNQSFDSCRSIQSITKQIKHPSEVLQAAEISKQICPKLELEKGSEASVRDQEDSEIILKSVSGYPREIIEYGNVRQLLPSCQGDAFRETTSVSSREILDPKKIP